ncbi:hypothetical protein [Phaeobacter sp. JH209B]
MGLKLLRRSVTMQITGQSNVSVYRMLSGHMNGQQAAQAGQPGEQTGGLESVASVAKKAAATSTQAALTGPSEGASMMAGTQYLRSVVQQKLQDLQSGYHAGPLPVSEVIAQNQYRAAQRVIG